ncbi:MAG: CrcB family protein [Chloroflexi bacterium]|nr:CrcB family protein [Chloroflexota bacterium]
MDKFIWIAFAGALGSLARYGVATYVQRNADTSFPWGVFAVNMLGSFAFGFIWAYSEDHGWVSEDMRTFALAGFLGAFTTFSTFAFDNAQLARSSNWQFFVMNIVLANAAGIALAFAGLRAGKAI